MGVQRAAGSQSVSAPFCDAGKIKAQHVSLAKRSILRMPIREGLHS